MKNTYRYKFEQFNGEEFIKNELEKIENEAVKRILSNNLKEIENGKRDFRF